MGERKSILEEMWKRGEMGVLKVVGCSGLHTVCQLRGSSHSSWLLKGKEGHRSRLLRAPWACVTARTIICGKSWALPNVTVCSFIYPGNLFCTKDQHFLKLLHFHRQHIFWELFKQRNSFCFVLFNFYMTNNV